MNITKLIFAATLATSAGVALADSGFPSEKPFVSTKTRAEVIAELNEAGGNMGRINYLNTTKHAHPASARTRAEVVAELNHAGGDMARINYRNTVDTQQPTSAGKTRSEVIAELQQATGNQARENYRGTFNPASAAVAR